MFQKVNSVLYVPMNIWTHVCVYQFEHSFDYFFVDFKIYNAYKMNWPNIKTIKHVIVNNIIKSS